MPAPFGLCSIPQVQRVPIGGTPYMGSKKWPLAARISGASVLIKGDVIFSPIGEKSAGRKKRGAMVPARTAPAPAPEKAAPRKAFASVIFERTAGGAPANFTLGEQRLFRTLQILRRKSAAAKLFQGRAIGTRPALAKAIRALRAGHIWKGGGRRAIVQSAPVHFTLARFALARALRRQRAADRKAGAIAGMRARFYAFGKAVLKERETGAIIGRAIAKEIAPKGGAGAFEIGANGAYDLDTTQGTGRQVDMQALREMRAAARADILAGGTWKSASKAAASELHRALQCPLYDDVEKAMRAKDRAFALSAENWKTDESGGQSAGQSQPHCAEYLAENNAESNLAPQSLVYARALRAMRAAIAYWRNARTPYARRGIRDDMAAIRTHARAVLDCTPQAGMRAADRTADKAANASYMNAHRLGQRVTAGGALLLAAEKAAPAPAPRTRTAPAALISLPLGFAENWTADLRHPALAAYALHLLGKAPAPAQSLAALADWHPGMR